MSKLVNPLATKTIIVQRFILINISRTRNLLHSTFPQLLSINRLGKLFAFCCFSHPFSSCSFHPQTESLRGKQVSVEVQLKKCRSRTETLQNVRAILVKQTRLFAQIHRCLETRGHVKPEVQTGTGASFCPNMLRRKNHLNGCTTQPRSEAVQYSTFLVNHRHGKHAQLPNLSGELKPIPNRSPGISANPRETNNTKFPRGTKLKSGWSDRDRNCRHNNLLRTDWCGPNFAENLTKSQDTTRRHSTTTCVPLIQLTRCRTGRTIGPSLLQKQHALIKYEWKLVAQLVDRFVFALFLLSTGLCYTLLFLWPFLVPADFNCTPG